MHLETIISANKISIGYTQKKDRRENRLYNNLSFDLYNGELVCLLGINGAGKSTLLRTISNSQKALNGNILLYGKKICTYTEKDLSRILGLVLTDKTSVGGLTVRELVELGRYPYTGFFGQLDQNDKRIIEKSMADVGIIHKADSYMAELSDGERQRVMIAKVLSQECPIIILDEPTAFLDITSRIEIMNLLHTLATKHNKTILMSTHDIELALLLADRLWLLSQSCGLQAGVTEDIIVSGDLDYFFGNKNISFDKQTGNFLPILSHTKKVFIEADGYLLHWTKNLLSKQGYKPTDRKEESHIQIKVSRDATFELSINGIKKGILSSFGELLMALR